LMMVPVHSRRTCCVGRLKAPWFARGDVRCSRSRY
jgi:hypothetical protein